ncbi:hypothetical protein HAPAU_36800 [Halalkalicoccus paucihalophilus]|uniref:Uncharacterized protein n=1 Tax=Halalkalicoccus paucihalophilus TaxID=1008153 RepID=A0A151A9B9_9EURY|nr:hypothetical protein [Halalkalicoccus paucihalophilus]KYH24209.1 hypothetical protein HAPAU_36800 [Halalkalicoccus paucihalophilus]
MVVITLIVLVTLIGLNWVLYSSHVQNSERYQAMVVPIANIMDIGFVLLAPAIVYITGLESPLTYAGLCALAYAMGWVIRYNIERFEPIAKERGILHDCSYVANWMLIIASIVNVGYYLQLMGVIIIYPFDFGNGDSIATIIAVVSLIALGVIGYFFGLSRFNQMGQRTTAFNLAAVLAIIAGFLAYNGGAAVAGNWSVPAYNPPVTTTDFRYILGFYVIVQGFEASRYLTKEYSTSRRIQTMRNAQIIATVIYVLFSVSTLFLFDEVGYAPTPAVIITISEVASPVLPLLVLLLVIGSQFSASINDIHSRSDTMEELSDQRIPRRYTFPLLAAGSIVVVLSMDVFTVVAAASRMFAAYYALQCLIALIIAGRRRQWTHFVGFTAVGLAMVAIAIFGLSTSVRIGL